MKHKNIFVISLVVFCVIICAIITAIGILGFKNNSDRRGYENDYLSPFHNVYDLICEKYPFITSLRQDIGDDGIYGMYYIECDIAENIDCFDQLVDIQCEINTIMETRKDDEWFKGFKGHIEVISGEQSLRVFYDGGTMSNEIWANSIISDDYSILFDAFPIYDEILLIIFLSDHSNEIAPEITQEYKGRNITIIQQIGG